MRNQIFALCFEDEIVTGEQVRKFINTWIVPTASVVVVCTALLGLIQHIIRSDVSDMSSNIQTLNDNVKSLRTDLDKNSDKIDAGLSKANDRIDTVLTKALERAFPSPQSSKEKIRASLNEMRGLLQFAMQQNIKLNPQMIAAYGREVAMVATDPTVSASAWETSLSLLNYRSFLNVNLVPTFPNTEILNSSEAPNININFRPLSLPPIGTVPPATKIWEYQLWAHGAGAAPDKAALLERISKPRTSGGNFEIYIFDGMGGTITLDDQRMRNVVLQNSVIEYNGGPTILENVYFVNCIFRIRYTPNGSHLGNELLASASTRFTASS